MRSDDMSVKSHAVKGSGVSAEAATEPPPTTTAPEPTQRRRPSDNPAELAQQLLRELDRVRGDGTNSDPEGDKEEAFWLIRAYLEHAQTLAWQVAAKGDPEGPRRALEALRPVHAAVARDIPDLSPYARAAIEIDVVMQALDTAHASLEEEQVKSRLLQPGDLSALSREVLAVLKEHENTFLRRKQVWAALPSSVRPSEVRVGQVLGELYLDGLLLRRLLPAQGNGETGHFALSEQGGRLLKAAQQADLEREERRLARELRWADQLLDNVLTPTAEGEEWKRSFALGTLTSGPLHDVTKHHIAFVLYARAHSATNPRERSFLEARCQDFFARFEFFQPRFYSPSRGPEEGNRAPSLQEQGEAPISRGGEHQAHFCEEHLRADREAERAWKRRLRPKSAMRLVSKRDQGQPTQMQKITAAASARS